MRRKLGTDLSHTIPMSFHADAGPMSKTKSAEIACWGSAVGEGKDFQRRFLSATWVKETHLETDNKFWEEFFDSLYLMSMSRQEKDPMQG